MGRGHLHRDGDAELRWPPAAWAPGRMSVDSANRDRASAGGVRSLRVCRSADRYKGFV